MFCIFFALYKRHANTCFACSLHFTKKTQNMALHFFGFPMYLFAFRLDYVCISFVFVCIPSVFSLHFVLNHCVYSVLHFAFRLYFDCFLFLVFLQGLGGLWGVLRGFYKTQLFVLTTSPRPLIPSQRGEGEPVHTRQSVRRALRQIARTPHSVNTVWE